MLENESAVPQNEEEVDSLLADLQEPTNEALTDPGAKPAEQTQESAAQSRLLNELAFQHGGKEIKLDLMKDREKAIKWLQMGYDAPNKIGELNKIVESYKAKEPQYKQWEETYGPVDKYVKENPDFWQHVTQTYQQRLQQSQQDPANPIIQELKQRLEKIEGVAQTYEQRQAEIAQQQEDAKYMESFTTIQKQYPTIDFATPDESGKTLEYKVLEHANANGIKSFQAAFRDFYHDQLMQLKSEEAKEKVINDKRMSTKFGILGTSTAPTKRVTDSVKGKSYDDLTREALAEHGIT